MTYVLCASMTVFYRLLSEIWQEEQKLSTLWIQTPTFLKDTVPGASNQPTVPWVNSLQIVNFTCHLRYNTSGDRSKCNTNQNFHTNTKANPNTEPETKSKKREKGKKLLNPKKFCTFLIWTPALVNHIVRGLTNQLRHGSICSKVLNWHAL